MTIVPLQQHTPDGCREVPSLPYPLCKTIITHVISEKDGGGGGCAENDSRPIDGCSNKGPGTLKTV